MKQRVTLTISPDITHKAKYLARERHTSVSALVESLLKQTMLSSDKLLPSKQLFVKRWTGKLTLQKKKDPRFELLRKNTA